jgi:hypothetical protein
MIQFSDAFHSIIAMINYVTIIGKSSEGFLLSHSTISFATSGKRNIDGDEEIKATFSFILRHADRVITSAKPIYEVLDKLQELLARYQTLLLLEDPPVSSVKPDPLAKLWTKVHGNGKHVNRRLELLKDLKDHSGEVLVLVMTTLNPISAAVHRLEEMRKGLQVAEV